MNDLIVVGSVADCPFASDIGHYLGQVEDYSDIISLKSFLNTEFCPRFIVDSDNWKNIGDKLHGKKVIITSTAMGEYSRNELAMHNFLVARAAKDNGAERVILLEPDLFYSAQDRGPKPEHGLTAAGRDETDYKKFDGQPFSSRLYADLLKSSGIDEVVTVHNHSASVQNVFSQKFHGFFHHLLPSKVYAQYLTHSDIVDVDKLILCSPDKGAYDFVKLVQAETALPHVKILRMHKERSGERDVDVYVDYESELDLGDIEGKDIVVVDDMVRTGNTILECCKLIRKGSPRRIIFLVTHFYSSREGRITLNDPDIDEIVTTSTIPKILNRDMQGRLRHKMVVLRIARWISDYITHIPGVNIPHIAGPLYTEDISSKNPRWKGRL
ncbi:MAG: ribose-phosphate pyrophosphokinase [Spirochaetales bacterium]|nr:ribose-phosphate pyrophosphokinase [Spirochaetales bacterium]